MERTCTVCERTLLSSAFYKGGRNACKECRKKAIYARRETIKAAGCCIECRSPIEDGTLCVSCKAVHLKRYYENRDDYLSVQKVRRRKLKMAALEAYGGPKCRCCGEKHIEFLTIDHIKGDGAAHRREMLEEKGWNVTSQSMSGTHLYMWLKQNGYPLGFRVLCMNCNFAIGHSGSCPHRAKVQKEPTNGTIQSTQRGP